MAMRERRMTPDQAGAEIAQALRAGRTVYWNGLEGRSRHAPAAYVPDGGDRLTVYTLTRQGQRHSGAHASIMGVAGDGLRAAWIDGNAWAEK